MSRRGAIEENGFTVLHGLFPPEYLDCLLEQINRLLPRRSRAGVRHALGLAPVEELARHQVMMELAVEVLGSDAFPFRATLFDKVTGGELACCLASGHRLAFAVPTGITGLGALVDQGGDSLCARSGERTE